MTLVTVGNTHRARMGCTCLSVFDPLATQEVGALIIAPILYEATEVQQGEISRWRALDQHVRHSHPYRGDQGGRSPRQAGSREGRPPSDQGSSFLVDKAGKGFQARRRSQTKAWKRGVTCRIGTSDHSVAGGGDGQGRHVPCGFRTQAPPESGARASGGTYPPNHSSSVPGLPASPGQPQRVPQAVPKEERRGLRGSSPV